jgi:hypothetical protein
MLFALLGTVAVKVYFVKATGKLPEAMLKTELESQVSVDIALSVVLVFQPKIALKVPKAIPLEEVQEVALCLNQKESVTVLPLRGIALKLSIF